MDVLTEEQLSDDEIFVGKFSLKEVKKCVLWNKQRDRCRDIKNAGMDSSLRIIETHSTPDILHLDSKSEATSPHLKAASNPVLSPFSSPNKGKATDDSFLKIEKMVTDLCVSHESSGVVLDNTLDVIDYILKNGPTQDYDNAIIKTNEVAERNVCINTEPVTSKVTVHESNIGQTPIKTHNSQKEKNTPIVTPSRTGTNSKKADFTTPFSNMKSNVKTSGFKTPGNPASNKKTPHSLLKKSLTKASYNHVASPVASYINNCPIVPLIKDVRPSKPLPGHSAIPKFVKSSQCKPSNKENVKLPTVAYKSAKKTEVIDIPDAERMPQSQWAKKITSSLPQPLVMKHDHREINIAKRMFMSKHDDRSFADLSLQQADVSVCTQKSAFNRPKKN